MGHAAMIGEGAPAVGGPHDLDALLYPPAGAAVRAGPRARVHADGGRPRDRGRPGRVLPRLDLQRHRARPGAPGHRGRHPPRPVRQRRLASAHDPLPRDPPDEHGRRLRDRAPGGRFTYEFEAKPYGMQLYHCHATPAEEAHPQGPLRRADHRPEGAARARAGARDGDERLRHRRRRDEQLLHGQRPHVLLRALPDPGQALRARAPLPRQPDRVRPDQLVPPARRLLPLLPDRVERPVRVHGHGDAVPGPARDPRDRVLPHRARSCSTRTSRSSPSSAGWATSRSST